MLGSWYLVPIPQRSIFYVPAKRTTLAQAARRTNSINLSLTLLSDIVVTPFVPSLRPNQTIWVQNKQRMGWHPYSLQNATGERDTPDI